MRKLSVLLAALASVLVLGAGSATAVTDGELDGDQHPAVVLVLMEVDGQPAFRCSGTLIAPTYVLTAGHCAGEPGEFSGMRVFTESDVQSGNNNYPFAGPNAIEAVRWAAHPQYTNAQFFLHDVGMIELEKPFRLPKGKSYGTLPRANQLDSLKPGESTRFTAVGYGLQKSFPDATSWKEQRQRVRYYAQPYLVQINGGIVGDFSLLLSNNAHSGGTCFGDSGGPNYLGGLDSNLIAGVTSFGLNGTCGGTGGVFRVDRQNVLDFVSGFMSS